MSTNHPSTTAAERRDGDTDVGDPRVGTGLATKTRAKTKQPTPYRVLMLNDDYTPMEFVVLCLQRFFRMTTEEATQVMLESRAVTSFPLGDQEILLRQLHHTTHEWVDEYEKAH